MTDPATPLTATPLTATPLPATPAPRRATAADLGAIEHLLTASGLPTAGVAELLALHADDVLVVDDPAGGALLAAGALEVRGASALLRSLAVRADARHLGLGAALVRALVRHAARRGVRALYLLTTTAESWFPRFGFARVERDTVPAEIGATVEFQGACPASATVMALVLDVES
jgi:amino-acid N-acetyltransferase